MALLKSWHDSRPVVPLEAVTYPKGLVHPWVAWIAEPRAISVLLGAFHLVAGVAGVMAIVIPDDYYEMLGAISADAWGMMLLAGGLAGMVGALPGWWWLERVGLWLEFFGTLAWQVAAWSVHHDPTPVVVFRIMLGALVQLSCVNRYIRISGAFLDPRRIKSPIPTP